MSSSFVADALHKIQFMLRAVVTRFIRKEKPRKRQTIVPVAETDLHAVKASDRPVSLLRKRRCSDFLPNRDLTGAVSSAARERWFRAYDHVSGLQIYQVQTVL